MLLYLGEDAFGHCTTHTATMNSETKDRAVKPVASKAKTNGMWKEKGVTGLSIAISAEGLIYDGETEASYQKMLAAWKSGQPVKIKCMQRGESKKPYLAGSFIISSLERTDPAQDDSTYTINLDNNGEPDTLDETAFTDGTVAAGGTDQK
jgi:predicted secreted protein|nr:MAG: tail tube protein family protein [Bacteriophage sp.]UWF94369.1 MAG: tail tube protein family protein [Bacteriophage sp.]UWI37160.1 MAG: tail tube protein family protein [Bacteriophage sp.]